MALSNHETAWASFGGTTVATDDERQLTVWLSQLLRTTDPGGHALGFNWEGPAMATISNASDATRELRKVRQARLYERKPIPQEVLQELLQVARWTGSSRNTQPWEFIVIDDPEQLRKISEIRTPINWVADAPLAIAIVLNGGSETSEAYDEGRVTERLLIGAHMLGLGGGIAWFGDDVQQAEGKQILSIPAERTARSVVVLGYPTTTKDHRPNPAVPGRRPLAELVSHNTYGQKST